MMYVGVVPLLPDCLLQMERANRAYVDVFCEILEVFLVDPAGIEN